MHPCGHAGVLQRSPSVPDAEAQPGRLVDIAVLIRGAVEEVVEKSLSGLILTIVPMQRRMRRKRDERNLGRCLHVASMRLGVHGVQFMKAWRNAADHLYQDSSMRARARLRAHIKRRGQLQSPSHASENRTTVRDFHSIDSGLQNICTRRKEKRAPRPALGVLQDIDRPRSYHARYPSASPALS